MILPNSFGEQRRKGIGRSKVRYKYHKLASSWSLAPVDVDVERRTWSKWKMMYPNIGQLDRSEARHTSVSRR
jgi:hypothetical protein